MLDSELVDAIHFTHRQPFAAHKAQESFQQSYPKSLILTVIDLGGAETEKFNFSEKVTVIRSEKRLSERKNGFYLSASQLRKFIGYYMQASEMRSHSEWLFVLEDDVKVIKPVDNLQYDLNGSVCEHFNNNIRKRIIFDTRFRYLKYRHNFYGGCGGSFVSKRIIQKFSVEKWVTKLEKYSDLTSLGSDQVLSLMTILAGGTIGPYAGFVEPWHHDFQEKTQTGLVTTLHRYKDLYVE